MTPRSRAPRSALRALSLTIATLLGPPSLASAQGPCDEAILTRTSYPDEPFSPSITEIDGDRMLVSAASSATQPQFRGAVFVFDRDPLTGQWTETQELEPSLPVPFMNFGSSLILEGDLAIVAARGTSGPGWRGRVHIFRRDPSTGVWSESQFVRDPAGTSFGVAIDYLDGHLAVTDTSGPRVFLYRVSPATGLFVPDGVIRGPGAIMVPRFGVSLEYLDTDTIAISDPESDAPGETDAGQVSIYRRVGSSATWALADSIRAQAPSADDLFGRIRGWDGEHLYVDGAPIGNVQFYQPRPVIEFTRDASGEFVETGRIEPDPSVLVQSHGLIDLPEDGVALVQELIELAPGSRLSRVRRFIEDSATGTWYPSTVLDAWEPQNAPLSNEFVSREGDRVVWTRTVRSPLQDPFRYVAVASLVECEATGYAYCAPAVPNSTGASASLEVHADLDDPEADVMLLGRGLPAGAATLALVSDAVGYELPVSSAGPLCLGGAIGRHVVAPPAGSGGTVAVRLGRTELPSAAGPVAAAPGTTWNFQLWYRDAAGAQPSNLSSARTVLFR